MLLHERAAGVVPLQHHRLAGFANDLGEGAVVRHQAGARHALLDDAAAKVGKLIAERAKAAGVEAVVLDRGGNRYAGRVAAVADGAREGGLAL